MKKNFHIALGAMVACGLGSWAMAQDAAVDPAELKGIVAQHPDWANWLADPALAKLVLAGPKLPDSPWHVHDIRRPQPVHVATGKACATPPPSDAELLFGGKELSKWTGDHFGEWTLKNGELITGGRVYNFLQTREQFGDVQVHVEWKTPPQKDPPVNPQRRSNSGVFLMGLYELQILDSYNTATYPDGTAGGIYGQTPPLVNATRPPGVWQCYDIVFHAPHFSGGAVTAPPEKCCTMAC